MSASTVKFPVAIIHYSAPPVPGGVERVVAEHAKALAHAGYPVRLIVGEGAEPSPDVLFRRVPLLSSTHPRILALTHSLARGEVGEDYEVCVLDLAQAIGRELVGCETVIVHNCLTMPFNLPAAEAMWRLEKGSRGPKVPGAPQRRWVVWAHDCAAASEGYEEFDRKERPWSLLRQPLPGARYVAVSEARRKAVAKALKVAQKDLVVVPDGADVAEFLELTPNVRELAREMGLLEADAVMLTPARIVQQSGLERGLGIVRALSRAKRGIEVRWLLTGEADPHSPAACRAPALAGLRPAVLAARCGAPGGASGPGARSLADEFLAQRDKLKLGDSVRVLAAECEWAGRGVPESDLRALYRLADALFLPSVDEAFGMPVLEGALARCLLVLGPAPALAELAGRDRGGVTLGPRQTPAQAARRILAGLGELPASKLRRRVLRELDWDAIARDYLVALVEGKRPAKRRTKGG